MGRWPVSRSTHWQWVSVLFLTLRSFSRKPRWRTCAGVVVFEESYDREEVVHTWQPYRPAVKVKTWKRNGKGQLAVTSSLRSGYGRPKVVCHISRGCVHSTSITSKSDSKIWIEWRVPEVCHHTWWWESQKCSCWRRNLTFVLSVFILSPLKHVYSS